MEVKMGIPERREREKEHRKNTIIDAAEKVFFSQGIENPTATMDEVAEAAELSKGTIYLYFKNKRELYLAITERGLRTLLNLFQIAVKMHDRGLDKVNALGRAYYNFAKQYPDYYYAMSYFDPEADEQDMSCPIGETCHNLGEKALLILIDALKQGKEDGSIRPDLDPSKTALILWGQTSGIIQLVTLKGIHMLEAHNLFGFNSTEEIFEYFFELMQKFLIPASNGENSK